MDRKNLIALFLVLLTLSVVGCGGSSGSSGSGGAAMTQAQAASAFSEVFVAMEDASSALPLDRPNPISSFRKEEATAIRNALLNGARMPNSTSSVASALMVLPDSSTTIPTFTYQCPSGGTIVVTGFYSDTSTSESANIVETINSCHDDGIVMNGDPNITLSLNGSDNGTTTTVSLTMTGGLTVGSSSCSTDLTVTASVNDKTGTGNETYSGSFCNVSINGSTAI
ncbi:MAG: hypothetical protein ABR907_01720 [Terracidiphilus sp.]|jgi:hypothetical protein